MVGRVPTNADSEKAMNTISSDYTASLNLARKWLSHCQSSHDDCKIHERQSTKRRNPSRVLFLGKVSHTDDVHLRICNSDASPITYATLSHCWGSLEVLKLTKETLPKFLQRILVGDLCKSFQDAIFVARFLGFDYLWIDSLCIIQDDTEDWLEESALMSSVYGLSSLNIAASGAADGSEGLFFARIPPQFRTYEMTVEVRGHNLGYECRDPYTYFRCIGSQPLAKRAWAIQERILAPRTLSFSRTELFWECKTQSACETSPEFFPFPPAAGGEFLRKSSLLTWETIVLLYTSANLTFSRDKLIALSGLARHFHKRTAEDTYLAGLWRKPLPMKLCWRVDNPQPRPTSYRAPTWSWASVDGRILLQNDNGNEMPRYVRLIDVIHVSVDHAGGGEFGEASGGTLMLGCKVLLPGQLTAASSEEHIVRFPACSMDVSVGWDFEELKSKATGTYYFVAFDIDSFGHSGELTWGLILVQLQGKQGQYHRVGRFKLNSANNDNYFNLKDMMAGLEAADRLKDRDFVRKTTSSDGETIHVIVIL